MAWLAVNKDGSEVVSVFEPYRTKNDTWNCNTEIDDGWEETFIIQISSLPKGSIEKLLGYKMTWTDDPVEFV